GSVRGGATQVRFAGLESRPDGASSSGGGAGAPPEDEPPPPQPAESTSSSIGAIESRRESVAPAPRRRRRAVAPPSCRSQSPNTGSRTPNWQPRPRGSDGRTLSRSRSLKGRTLPGDCRSLAGRPARLEVLERRRLRRAPGTRSIRSAKIQRDGSARTQ